MSRNKFMTADQAVGLIKDGDTVALVGGGGGLMEATHTFRAVSRRFLTTGYPRDLTVVHALGIGELDMSVDAHASSWLCTAVSSCAFELLSKCSFSWS